MSSLYHIVSVGYVAGPFVTLLSRSDVISTAKLEEALAALKGLSGEAKTRSIVEVLDEDHDGNINLDEIAEVS